MKQIECSSSSSSRSRSSSQPVCQPPDLACNKGYAFYAYNTFKRHACKMACSRPIGIYLIWVKDRWRDSEVLSRVTTVCYVDQIACLHACLQFPSILFDRCWVRFRIHVSLPNLFWICSLSTPRLVSNFWGEFLPGGPPFSVLKLHPPIHILA